jgi:hypothetical protein
MGSTNRTSIIVPQYHTDAHSICTAPLYFPRWWAGVMVGLLNLKGSEIILALLLILLKNSLIFGWFARLMAKV